MPVNVNLRHVEAHNIELAGQVPVGELDIETRDEVIRLAEPLHYELEVQKLEDGLLVQGRLSLKLNCECVRCLKPFRHELKLDHWTCHIPLQGEEAVKVTNDCVDLTPYLREDILLEFPQHPVCDAGCVGLPDRVTGKSKKTSSTGKPGEDSSAWSELNKLKF
jgi:uncharacterized protein